MRPRTGSTLAPALWLIMLREAGGKGEGAAEVATSSAVYVAGLVFFIVVTFSVLALIVYMIVDEIRNSGWR